MGSIGLVVLGGTCGYGPAKGLVLSIVFGAVGVFLAGRQLRGFVRRGPWTTGQWLLNHMSGFVSAYSAAVSAFSATSLRFISWPWNFLWPTLVMVPPLVWVQRCYKQRFRKASSPQ